MREIGSSFWLNPNESDDTSKELSVLPGYAGSDVVLLSSCRSAIRLVIDATARRNPGQKKIALIPPFTCEMVLQPFIQEGYLVQTFPIDKHLCTRGTDLLDATEKAGATIVLLHRYFGFETLPGCAEVVHTLRSHGVTVIEDRTQSLYSKKEPLPADYQVGSLRKWAALPDGGFAICREGVFEEKPTVSDYAVERAYIEAAHAKYRYLFEKTGNKINFLAKFHQAEALIDAQSSLFAISPASLRIQRRLDTEQLCRRRRENYATLLNALWECTGICPMFSEITSDVVPLYFPIWVKENRQALREHLAKAGIYAPGVWPRPERLPQVCPEAESLYDHILCLPIDQRYEANDMEQIGSCIRNLNI